MSDNHDQRATTSGTDSAAAEDNASGPQGRRLETCRRAEVAAPIARAAPAVHEVVTGERSAVAVVGGESVGKSALVSALSGSWAYSANFRGSTIAVQIYPGDEVDWVDTPGLLFASDAATTATALQALNDADAVLLVIKATDLDRDLAQLLPLVHGRRGIVAVTFWDKVQPGEHAWEGLEKLAADLGVAVVAVDARQPSAAARAAIEDGLRAPGTFQLSAPRHRFGWRIEPHPGPLEWRYCGPWLALGLLLGPTWGAVQLANTVAGTLDPVVSSLIAPLVAAVANWPPILADVFAGRYGLLTMGPLLFVWALPTILFFAAMQGVYQASGLMDRMTTALQPWMRHVGLTGRDLVRVVMGLGCNVPAVISTRSCSSCTRGTCLHAIGFGSACSYQMGATLAVFAAAGAPSLIWPYLGYLVLTTLVYTRLVSNPQARSPLNVLTIEGRAFVTWPRSREVLREAWGTLREFLGKALPLFIGISIGASLLDTTGVLPRMAVGLAPVMHLFHLPGDAALAMIVAGIRKDGLLLFADEKLGAALSAGQLLTAVFLGGVLVPCLVTVTTIAREQSWRFAGRLVLRQMLAAVMFAIVLGLVARWVSPPPPATAVGAAAPISKVSIDKRVSRGTTPVTPVEQLSGSTPAVVALIRDGRDLAPGSASD